MAKNNKKSNRCENAGGASRSSKVQRLFFSEYEDALKPMGLTASMTLEIGKDAGLPDYLSDDLKQFFGMLNEELQFLVADGLISYFTERKREYSGLRMLDEILDRLFEKMDHYIFPKDAKD